MAHTAHERRHIDQYVNTGILLAFLVAVLGVANEYTLGQIDRTPSKSNDASLSSKEIDAACIPWSREAL